MIKSKSLAAHLRHCALTKYVWGGACTPLQGLVRPCTPIHNNMVTTGYLLNANWALRFQNHFNSSFGCFDIHFLLIWSSTSLTVDNLRNLPFCFFADTQLYKRLCLSVHPSVGPSVGPSVCPLRLFSNHADNALGGSDGLLFLCFTQF